MRPILIEKDSKRDLAIRKQQLCGVFAELKML